MSLEQKYLTAENGTYVASVRDKQAPFTTTGRPNSDFGLVNYMDGTRRRTRADDEFQTEFKRNEAGAYVVGGAQGVLRSQEQMLTRWTDRALKLAFETKGNGPVSLINGYYNSERFRVATGPKGSVSVHNYAPLQNKKFVDTNNSAKAKINGNPALTPKV
jgi:hypothetical protein